MTSKRYKKLKKEIKQKIKKIKDYEIDDNKLAALVFIITAVLGIRAGNYLRLFVFEHETNKIRKKRKKEKEYSNIYREPEPELIEAPSDNESKWPDDPRTGIGALEVSLFGKSKNRKFKKVALASLLGGGLGVGTGIYLRNNKIKKERKIEEKKRKEREEMIKKDEEVCERTQKKLRESDTPESIIKKPRKKIEFEDFDQEIFNQYNTPFEDDTRSFEIGSGTIGLEEEKDYYRALEKLEKSKKKLKDNKKQTKKGKRIFSRNKDANKKIGIIKEKIKENEKQAEKLQEFYDDYFKNKEKHLSKRQLVNLLLKGKDRKDLVKLMSEEAGEDADNLKYFTPRELEQKLEEYPFWKLQKMYENQKAKEEYQKQVWELLNSTEEEAEQEVMLFGKKKRKRKRRKKKRN